MSQASIVLLSARDRSDFFGQVLPRPVGCASMTTFDGDYAMLENELQPVLRAMRKEGINIVAIHQHMSHEQPRYLFLHYWGKGKAADLAQSLKRVLDAQAAVKS